MGWSKVLPQKCKLYDHRAGRDCYKLLAPAKESWLITISNPEGHDVMDIFFLHQNEWISGNLTKKYRFRTFWGRHLNIITRHTMKCSLYLCSHKMREVSGNPSLMPKKFPETRGTSRGSREISRAEGVDFPIPPEFKWSTEILFFINPSLGVGQEIPLWEGLVLLNPILPCKWG